MRLLQREIANYELLKSTIPFQNLKVGYKMLSFNRKLGDAPAYPKKTTTNDIGNCRMKSKRTPSRGL